MTHAPDPVPGAPASAPAPKVSNIPTGKPKISAVINVYNPRFLPRVEATIILCVEALREFTTNPIEIIVTDGSGVENKTVREACERAHAIYTVSPVPQIYAAIFNHGLRMATGEYLAVLENDVFVSHKWDELMLKEMERTGASLSVPYLTSCDVMPQQNGFVVKRRTFEPSNISQNLMLFDREAYQVAFPMDEQFNGAFNDNEIYILLKRAGKRIICCNAGMIVHYRRSSLVYNMFNYHKDVELFCKKYPELGFNGDTGFYRHERRLFYRSHMYDFLHRVANRLPGRAGKFMRYHLQRFEPVFQPA